MLNSAFSNAKVAINKLYGKLSITSFNSTNICFRTATKLSEIENLLPVWKMLENRLEQLQKDLKEDGKTIHILDNVLSNGQFTDQTATCVRDVAKVLSESTSYQVTTSSSYHTRINRVC